MLLRPGIEFPQKPNFPPSGDPRLWTSLASLAPTPTVCSSSGPLWPIWYMRRLAHWLTEVKLPNFRQCPPRAGGPGPLRRLLVGREHLATPCERERERESASLSPPRRGSSRSANPAVCGEWCRTGPQKMHLRIALLTLSQASSALAFVRPGPQALSHPRDVGRGARAGAADLRMVASVPASAVSTQGLNGDSSSSSSSSSSSRSREDVESIAVEQPAEGLRAVEMYDTTLRDGTQMEGISASVDDKLKITRQLAEFGEL